MDDLEPRLVTCFQRVFPELTDAQVRAADEKVFESWDSVKVVSLMAVIGEEFDVDMEEAVDEFYSFPSVKEAVQAELD